MEFDNNKSFVVEIKIYDSGSYPEKSSEYSGYGGVRWLR